MVMTVENVNLTHRPKNKRLPFRLEIVLNTGQVVHLDLTEQQVAEIYNRAMAPLMRARASRSTPGQWLVQL